MQNWYNNETDTIWVTTLKILIQFVCLRTHLASVIKYIKAMSLDDQISISADLWHWHQSRLTSYQQLMQWLQCLICPQTPNPFY